MTNNTQHFANIAQMISAIKNEWGFAPDEAVWRGADGSYVVGDLENADPEDFDCEYLPAGIVEEYVNHG